MKFPLHNLYGLNKSKPMVEVDGVDVPLQWDYCDLEGLPPEREGMSMVSHGTIPRGQRENLPETFKDTDGNEHRIEDIHSLKSS